MSELRRIIGEEIDAKGPISFARFMELALYCPVYGFYEKEADTIGRAGHFFTSTSVGPLFGELLAGEFVAWMSARGASRLLLVEAGAHDGRLALDILNWLSKEESQAYEACSYVFAESSERRRSWQRTTTSGHATKVSWVEDITAAGRLSRSEPQPLVVVFSNELLDAFPVHRFRRRSSQKRWIELGVGTDADGGFKWVELTFLTPEAECFLPPEHLSSSLPDGYCIEVSPSAADWWQRAGTALPQGKGVLMTFDYGLSEEDRLAPERTTGTLRSYRIHQVTEDVLEDPGNRDITAHVDFSVLQRIGEAAGLITEAFLPQGRYLTRIATARLAAGCGWDPARIRQFKTLTDPRHMGQSFKALVQSKCG